MVYSAAAPPAEIQAVSHASSVDDHKAALRERARLITAGEAEAQTAAPAETTKVPATFAEIEASWLTELPMDAAYAVLAEKMAAQEAGLPGPKYWPSGVEMADHIINPGDPAAMEAAMRGLIEQREAMRPLWGTFDEPWYGDP